MTDAKSDLQLVTFLSATKHFVLNITALCAVLVGAHLQATK
jgi:hypothetical protein